MTAGWRSTHSFPILSIITVVMTISLTGCQTSQPSPGESQQSVISWHVLESRGNVAIDNEEIFLDEVLQTGDLLTTDSQIVMDGSAYLIASRSGLQLTASGDTMLNLSVNNNAATLTAHHGQLRLRLAAAADDVKRIETPHLSASGTAATLELNIDDNGTEIAVMSGNVALSTPDGEHYVRLVAGATARVGDETLSALDAGAEAIAGHQPSDGKSWPSDGSGETSKHASLAPETQFGQSVSQEFPSVEPMPHIEEPGEMAIRLASNPRPGISEPEQQGALDAALQSNEPALKAAVMSTPTSYDANSSNKEDNLHKKFDALTEGLLDGLYMKTTTTNSFP